MHGREFEPVATGKSVSAPQNCAETAQEEQRRQAGPPAMLNPDTGAGEDGAGGAAEETAASAGGVAGRGGDGGRGRSGPPPFIDTGAALADLFIAQHRDRWRYNIDGRRWYSFDGRIWRPDEGVINVIQAMVEPIAQQILATVAGPAGVARNRALLSPGGMIALCNLIQRRAELHVRETDFDQHHHLLNTPGGVVDLRTGTLTEETDPTLLLRNITLMTPDLTVMWNQSYEQRCKRFFAVLANVSQGRENIIQAIRAWFAYTLTGDLRHQALMFLHGPPGVGKTVIAEVLFLLLGTYAFLVAESFFSKNGGGAKRFDMAGIIGKRMLFMDETQLGMSWDETRMCKLASAIKLVSELKFGRSVEFNNTAKIFIVGNHKPNFVAAETGGLTSRMLLTEAKGVNYRDEKNNGINGLARIIVDEEGSAILMWALEQCIADYDDPKLFAKLTADLKAASREYAKEDSLVQQWVAHEMWLADDADIDLIDAIKGYQKFCKDLTGRTPRVTWSEFKTMLKAAFPRLEFSNRTKGPHKNRAFIKGIGYPQVIDELTGVNVVPFPNASKASEKGDDEAKT
jgi:putative DNA primase/helicase